MLILPLEYTCQVAISTWTLDYFITVVIVYKFGFPIIWKRLLIFHSGNSALTRRFYVFLLWKLLNHSMLFVTVFKSFLCVAALTCLQLLLSHNLLYIFPFAGGSYNSKWYFSLMWSKIFPTARQLQCIKQYSRLNSAIVKQYSFLQQVHYLTSCLFSHSAIH